MSAAENRCGWPAAAEPAGLARAAVPQVQWHSGVLVSPEPVRNSESAVLFAVYAAQLKTFHLVDWPRADADKWVERPTETALPQLQYPTGPPLTSVVHGSG